MIDRIKIILDNPEFLPEKEKLFKNYKTPPKWKFTRRFRNLFNSEVQLPKGEKSARLRLFLCTYKDTGKTKLVFNGSIRKWYERKEHRKNLTYNKFIEVISMLEKEIGLVENSLWKAKVTQIEIGVTTGIKLKAEDRNFFLCIGSHKELTQKNSYSNTGVEFIGENYHVIFYDKISHIFCNKNKSLGKNINENYFVLRYEIQIHKISGVSLFEGKINKLWKIKKYWDEINMELRDSLDHVDYIDVISDEQIKKLKNCGKKELMEYFIFKGMESIGYRRSSVLFKNMTPNNRSLHSKSFKDIYQKHIKDDGTRLIFRVTSQLKTDIEGLLLVEPD
ncbi:hypothetical protein [Apibacter sp. HY039]|uniref:hypothetical protein n=1 Tax=Apibacter sp. HY039 TaxID=2501476 RepID=UPI000FEC144A|nr:hypothetical protein [Apibacter sp. HY039]